MNFSFTDKQVALRKEVESFAVEHLNKDVFERDQKQYFDRSLWEAAGKLKLPGLAIPESEGGRGLNAIDTAIALEALGFASEDNGFNFAIAAHLLACAVPLAKFGEEAVKKKYLSGMCDGSIICANSITEPGAGSDSNSMQTKADAKDDGFVINGNKIFISNGPVADISLLYAVTEKGKGFFGSLTAFVIDHGSTGFKTDIHVKKMGMHTAALGEQVLENVFVQESNVVGKVGSGGYVFNHSMEWERALLGAIHVGAMRRILKQLTKYVKKQYGKEAPQGIKHKVANLKVDLEAASLLLLKSAWTLENSKLVAMDAGISKLYVSEAFNRFTQSALEIMGMDAYSEESGIPRQIRDAASATIYSGTSEMQRNIIAGWLGI